MSTTPKILESTLPGKPDWLSAAELRALTPAELIARTAALRPMLAAHAREAETIRKPVDSVWSAIRKTGVFYHFVPKRYGGLEFDVESFVDEILPLGEGCASTAWVTSFCMEHNWLLALFPKQAQDEIFGSHPYIIAPGVTQPPGKAERVKGGYRVSGCWKWGTCVMHADWALGIAMIAGEGPPPQMLFCIMPISDVKILDTWQMDGMAGTGSNDVLAENVFVPEHRTVSQAQMREGKAPGAELHDSPLYKMPMLPFKALTAALPAVGAARGAVAAFRARLKERLVFGSDAKQAEKPAAQMRLAMADTQTRTAELLLRDIARALPKFGQRGSPATTEERIAMRMQVAYAVDLARAAVRTVCEASGASAHQLDNPLQRAQRDINVMASHVVYDMDAAMELHGRALVGLPPNSPLT
jgi:alkylation response protein AidB-like acyl-CoA dehydrogenase